MNHNPCLGKIAQLFITIFVIICQAHLECIVNLANGFESLLLFRGIQRSHLRMSVRWMAEIIGIDYKVDGKDNIFDYPSMVMVKSENIDKEDGDMR